MSDLINIIKSLQERVRVLEENVSIRNVTFPNDGKLVIPVYTADPAGGSSTNGQIYYNSTTNKFRGYENGSWVNLV